MNDERKDKGEKREVFEDVKRQTDKCSYVRQPERARGLVGFDIIRKDLISRERRAQSTWSQRFGHLSSENFKKALIEECEKNGLPSNTFDHKTQETKFEKESPVSLKPSPEIPKTSSAEVGWRSSLPEHNLEFLGQLYISPRSTIEPPLGPSEFRVTDQKFIFLG